MMADNEEDDRMLLRDAFEDLSHGGLSLFGKNGKNPSVPKRLPGERLFYLPVDPGIKHTPAQRPANFATHQEQRPFEGNTGGDFFHSPQSP
jgi:hypothetical protein